MSAPASPEVVDTINNPQHPFGLPPGSVRSFMSLLILSYFWLAVFWPGDNVKTLTGHFFLLGLVLYTLLPSRHHADGFIGHMLPWILRIAAVGGSVLVLVYMQSHGIENYRDRLLPDTAEFREWWIPFSCTLVAGLYLGYGLKLLFGERSPVFTTLRSWLSVVGMVMLVLEVGLFIIHLSTKSGDAGFVDFLRYYEFVELAIVSAYFGTRI